MRTTIEVEIDLWEFSTKALQRELKSRGIASENAVQLASELRIAFYARNASRFEALLVALDPQDEPTRGLYKEETTP